MSEDAEWGPWEQHDGKDCPLPDGTYAQARTQDGQVAEGTVRHDIGPPNAVNCWIWDECEFVGKPDWRVIEYRVRKPKGLTILEQIVSSPPQEPIGKPVPDLVPA